MHRLSARRREGRDGMECEKGFELGNARVADSIAARGGYGYRGFTRRVRNACVANANTDEC
jgi:hypothetical protein